MKSNTQNGQNFIQTILESGAKRLGIDAITLYPYDETINQFGIPFTYGLYRPDDVRGPMKQTGVAMRAFGLRQPHFAPNAPEDDLMACGKFVEREKICSSASFPLQVENRRVGILFVNYRRSPHDFDARECIALECFANEVAIALENAKLSRESEAIRSLHDMAQDALAIVDEETLLNTLVNNVKEAFDFDTVAIYWVDKDKEEIFRRYAAGLAENWFYGGGRRLDEKDILTCVVKTWETKIIEDWNELLDRKVYEACGHENLIRIFLPLVISNKAEGVLEAGNKRIKRHFISPGEQRALANFINQACLAIEKARRAKESAILVEIGKTLSSDMDLKVLLENITTQISAVVPYDNCIIYLIDSDGETVRPFHFVVKDKEIEEALRKFLGKIGEGYTGQVIQTGKGMIIERINEKPDVIIGTYMPIPTSYIVIPIKVQDRVIGTINMHRWIANPIQIPFQQHEFNFVSIIASQAAIVIENFQRYQRIFNITEQLQKVQNIENVYNRVMDGIMEFDYDRARLYLLEDNRYLVSVVSRGMGEAAAKFDNGKIRIDLQTDEWFGEKGILTYKPWLPVISRLDTARRNPWSIVAQEGAKRVRYLDSTPFEEGRVPYQKESARIGVKEWIDLPLVVGDKPIGVISVDHRRSQNPFSDDDFFILTQLSRHAAFAIESVRLFNQTQQHLRELELLKDQMSVAIRKMQRTTNLDDILNAILDGVQALGYKRVRLYRYSEEKHAFVGWKALGPKTPSNFEGYEIRLEDDTYARETYESPKARIHTLEKYGDTPGRKYLNKSEDTPWVSVPLVVGGKVYGQVNADNEGENREISQQDLELLDILAAHAALAIADAQAFDEMRRAQDNLRVITHGVAHSLKNPLFRMRLTLDLIRKKIQDLIKRKMFDENLYPDYYDSLDSIHKAIADGINDLLAFGKLEKSVHQAVNVYQLVHKTLIRYNSTFKGTFEVNIPEDFPCIADADQLPLAFDSIIKNAVDVMSEDDKLVVSAYASANESVIEFYNTALPISEELLPQLGKEMQSSKEGGSGIGLLIVNKIMELHKGDWKIENMPEGGVKVTLKLPNGGNLWNIKKS